MASCVEITNMGGAPAEKLHLVLNDLAESTSTIAVVGLTAVGNPFVITVNMAAVAVVE